MIKLNVIFSLEKLEKIRERGKKYCRKSFIYLMSKNPFLWYIKKCITKQDKKKSRKNESEKNNKIKFQ